MGFVSGAYYLGIPIGGGLSLVIAGFLGPLWGWRNCFLALGLLGLVLALLMLLFKETPKREKAIKNLAIRNVLTKKTFIESTHELRKTVKGSYALRMTCLLYTSPSPRDGLLSRMPSSA